MKKPRDDNALIAQIADGLRNLEYVRPIATTPLSCIEVVLRNEADEELSAMSLGCALDYLTSDIWIDGDGNDISGAVKAVVRTI